MQRISILSYYIYPKNRPHHVNFRQNKGAIKRNKLLTEDLRVQNTY